MHDMITTLSTNTQRTDEIYTMIATICPDCSFRFGGDAIAEVAVISTVEMTDLPNTDLTVRSFQTWPRGRYRPPMSRLDPKRPRVGIGVTAVQHAHRTGHAPHLLSSMNSRSWKLDRYDAVTECLKKPRASASTSMATAAMR